MNRVRSVSWEDQRRDGLRTSDARRHIGRLIMRHVLLRMLTLLCAALSFEMPAQGKAESPQERPNILWITSEDHGPHMGCYGDPVARTPNVDALAARGMLFTSAWSCAPVCAPARTTIITGMYPPSLGAEHMRSEVRLPEGVTLFPRLLRDAGYYCSNNSKEDYNVTKPGMVWNESSRKGDWRNRQPGQPFFAVYNSEASHESKIRSRPHQSVLDPGKVRIPAYHPDTPEVRQDWAQYYDQVSVVDAIAGTHLKRLQEDGLADQTIVFYFADHGSGMPRNKRWPGHSGLHVPMIVYFPEKWRHLAPREYKPGGKSDRLVSFVDLAPTLLSLAGIKPPSWMQGHAFAGKFQTEPQPFVYGFRGRMDERYDLARSVTDGHYVYLRNYLPHLSTAQHVEYQFETPTTRVWKQLFDSGKLNAAQSRFWNAPRDAEELYDLRRDPDEVENLASSPEHQSVLKKLRQAQQDLARKIRDTGYLTEAEVHARSGNQAPRDALQGDEKYPFEKVFAAAERASAIIQGDLPEIKKFLQDHESGVRYWGAVGILIRGSEAVNDSRQELLTSLSDTNVSVRIAAAEGLGTYGKPEELSRALVTLKECANPETQGAYAATAAMNVIDRLGSKATPLWADLKNLPTQDPRAVSRANGYVKRLQNQIFKTTAE